MHIKVSHPIAFALIGILCGLLSTFTITTIPFVGLFAGPGIIFAIGTLFYFTAILKRTSLQSSLALLWIIICTLAYFVAVYIVMRIQSQGFCLDCGIPRNYNPYTEYLKAYFSYGAGGLVGSLLMLLGVRYCLIKLSTQQLFLLTVLGGILSVIGALGISGKGNFVSLFTIWQTGMAFSLGYVIERIISPDPKNQQRLLLYGLVVLLILLIAEGAGYLLRVNNQQSSYPTTITNKVSPKRTPTLNRTNTSNWKIYTNTQYGFSFQYPSSWKEDKNQEKSTLALSPNIVADFATTRDSMGQGLDMQIFSNPNSVSAQDFISRHQSENNYPNMLGSHFKKNPSTLGIPGDWLIDRTALGAVGGEQALIPLNNVVVDLYCIGCNDQITDKILSTFKFTH